VTVNSNSAGDSVVRSLLAETLLKICAPRVAAHVVAEALHLAKLLEVPEDPTPFLRFVRVPLHQALCERFGADVADTAVDDLERVLANNRSSGTYSRTSTIAKINVIRSSGR
jgi:hypothetical protein